MNLKFTKMQGCGNDYVYINCFENQVNNPQELSIRLSDRNFGIGSDGVILICQSDIADAKMRMFNADGSEGKMCGNGIRCVAKYLYDRKIVSKTQLSIETLSGIKNLDLKIKDGEVSLVTVNMGKAELNAKKIPVLIDRENVISYPIKIGSRDYNITCVSMGNPHCIIFGGDPDNIDLPVIGPNFEKNPLFPEQVNTEFVQIIDEKTLKMRVWERGSGETLACGTGACATVVAAVLNGFCKKGEDIRVILKGGELVINYTDDKVLMTGPATIVFDGEVYL